MVCYIKHLHSKSGCEAPCNIFYLRHCKYNVVKKNTCDIPNFNAQKAVGCYQQQVRGIRVKLNSENSGRWHIKTVHVLTDYKKHVL